MNNIKLEKNETELSWQNTKNGMADRIQETEKKRSIQERCNYTTLSYVNEVNKHLQIISIKKYLLENII